MGRTTLDHWPVAADIFSIYDLLARLGVTANYVGFRQCAYAVYLCVQDPDKLALVTKWLYPPVAKRYHTTVGAIERNIRTVAKQAWKNNPALLTELAGGVYAAPPSSARFISMLSFYFLRKPPAA